MTSNSEAIYNKIALYLLALVEEDFVTGTLEFLETNGNEDELTKFENLSQNLEDYCNEIMEHQEQLTRFQQMDNVRSDINELKSIYNQVESPVNIDTLLMLIELSGHILSAIEDISLDLIAISFSDYCIIENVSENLSIQSYFYENNINFENSILFFNGNSSISELIEGGLTPDLATLTIGLLSDKEDILNKNFMIMKTCNASSSKTQALALLKLYLVCSGEKFHPIKELEPRNMQHYINKIDFELNYQQFNDSLIILSEYNSRKELLNKYISLYHMIENFMFKYPLVKLNRDKGGEMFSIRDFKDMYKKVDSSEPVSLEEFLKEALNANNKKLLNDIHQAFITLKESNTMADTDIDNVFTTLNVGSKSGCYTYTQISKTGFIQTVPSMLSKIIYVIRNSIVHNKETEFHLSHETLNDNIFKFIDKFLVPQIEDILFSLLIEENNIVWYKHQNIKLFA